jgi:Txe/YoeB family toxin of Txe-Axe toxin-antitoxin module
MEIEFSLRALDDLSKWKKSGNKIAQQKITELAQSILITPFEGWVNRNL